MTTHDDHVLDMAAGGLVALIWPENAEGLIQRDLPLPGRRVAQFPVSPEFLREMLHLPDTADVVGGWWDWNYGAPVLRVVVESPDFDPVPAGRRMPEAGPTFRSTPTGAVEFVEWGLR